MGNLRKLENVCASKASLTETAIKRPRKVELIAISRMPAKVGNQLIPDRSVRKRAKTRGTKAFSTPKMIAPVVFANMRRFSESGASRSLSKERLFLSKVIVTASMEVVPKRMDMETTPGRMLQISNAVLERTKNMRVHAKGKIIPQLILGGFR